ncbi:MAG: arginine N-succinyltransferase [Nitrosomonas sp.]|nr:MAG: arginine N-succinyltransferase [Nitrosomonas sp.]
MVVIRPIRESDQEAFEKFALTAGTGGTSLPRNSRLLKERILRSVASFNSENPVGGLYVFVLEDVDSGELAGTCSIDPKTQGAEGGFLFRVEEIIPQHTKLPMPKRIRILQPVQINNFASEVGGLYLLPKYRHSGNGRLLSLSRFLFAAAFPNRLQSTIIAEMRGRINKDGHSPFWDAIGKHLLNLPLNRVLAEVSENPSLIPKIMPQFPIYVSMLPLAAQRVIGRTHHNTKAAIDMLSEEGFQPTGEVDILAAGPRLAAQTANIRTIVNSRTATIGSVDSSPIPGMRTLISNEKLHFRVTYGTLIENPEDKTVTIHRDIAAILQVRQGDSIRYVAQPQHQHT